MINLVILYFQIKGKYANLIMPNSKTPHTTYQDTFTDPNNRLKAKIKK